MAFYTGDDELVAVLINREEEKKLIELLLFYWNVFLLNTCFLCVLSERETVLGGESEVPFVWIVNKGFVTCGILALMHIDAEGQAGGDSS